jgi:hypothetical protein
LIPAYQTARCHISEEKTTAVKIANIEILGPLPFFVLLWSGEKIRDKNIYRPEPVIAMSATWCSKNTRERRLFFNVGVKNVSVKE